MSSIQTVKGAGLIQIQPLLCSTKHFLSFRSQSLAKQSISHFDYPDTNTHLLNILFLSSHPAVNSSRVLTLPQTFGCRRPVSTVVNVSRITPHWTLPSPSAPLTASKDGCWLWCFSPRSAVWHFPPHLLAFCSFGELLQAALPTLWLLMLPSGLECQLVSLHSHSHKRSLHHHQLVILVF